jgi:hypothetical protein
VVSVDVAGEGVTEHGGIDVEVDPVRGSAT